jgi:hypothetical protein
MMEDKAVSLEVARELAPLLPKGFKSAFSHKINPTGINLPKDSNMVIDVPAPLLCEMLELLSEYSVITVHKKKQYLNIRFPESRFSIAYNTMKENSGSLSFCTHCEIAGQKQNPATAAAKLYIWLHKNGYIGETK